MRQVIVWLGLLSTGFTWAADTVQHGLRVPEGFVVTEYAGSDLANDIHTLTTDARGRVTVAGRGYLRLLVDERGQGKATRAITLLDGPADGAMGLLWEGDLLWYVGEGGLYRLREGEKRPELIRRLKTGAEHAAHAIRRGPDGWLYVLCGNATGIDSSWATLPTSPIKQPVAGCVVRLSPDLKGSEIIADGFRNPYDMDFHPDGSLFTYDSDNERCVSLPWYEGTRFYHVRHGGHHGWQSPHQGQFWRMPPWFPDVVPPVADLGRGSPTGCICYRHAQFPPEYRGGFFLADWTFGRIWFVPLKRKDQMWVGTPRLFLQSVGDNGFAPSGLSVDPTTGDLLVAIGGRGTRGAVYRIRYVAGQGNVDAAEVEKLRPRLEQTPRKATPVWAPLSVPEAMKVLADRTNPITQRLSAVRSLQLQAGGLTARAAHGTVWEGYTPRNTDNVPALRLSTAAVVRTAWPSGDFALDRELTRTLAVLEDEDRDLPRRLMDVLTPNSIAVDDIHHLIVLARLRGPWPEKGPERVATALLALDRKLNAAKLARDRNWPLRIAELQGELARHHPELNPAILNHPEFGRADHALFCLAPGFDGRRAAEVFLARGRQDPDYPWNAEILALMSHLPRGSTETYLRGLWGRGGINEALLPFLTKQPREEDRPRFLESLRSPQSAVQKIALEGLEALETRNDGPEILALLRALRNLPEGREGDTVRRSLGQALAKRTGETGNGVDARAWSAWFSRHHPTLAARLEGSDGVDTAAWARRLAVIPWTTGTALRGETVFRKTSCAACHSGAQALGPDLRGVANRFSREDLFTAMLQPSKDISPRYRTTAVLLNDGRSYQGMVIYEAVDGLILQTGPAQTVRIPGDKIEGKRTTDISLMPAGLLDQASDQEIADLYAYLKGLR